MKSTSNSGHISFGLLFIVVIAAIAGVGYWVWKNQSQSEPTSFTTTGGSCEGKFYDSHAHNDDEEVIDRLPELMTEHGVGCSVIFTQMDINDIDESLDEAQEEYEVLKDRAVIFYDVIAQDTSSITRPKLDELYEKSGGKFRGLGEFAFYQEPFRGTSLEAEPWPTIFQYAADKDLVVMIHPEPDLVPSLKAMLARYPDTKVLVHGFELPDQMPSLLKDNKNLYFTLDTATMLMVAGMPPKVLMYPGGGPNIDFNIEEFESAYDSNHDQMLATTVEDWLPAIMAAPEKVLWGTDVSISGHVESGIYELLIEFTNDFLKSVPEKYRDGYLKENALKLIGAGVALE